MLPQGGAAPQGGRPAGVGCRRVQEMCDDPCMRVAHVNDVASVGSTLVTSLIEAGVDARLVHPPEPGASWSHPAKLLTYPLRLAALLAWTARLRGQGDDLVHIHYARSGVVGLAVGKPFIVHCHGSDIRGVRPGTAWGRELARPLREASRVYYATPDLEPWVRAFRRDAEFLPNPIVPATWAIEPEGTRRDVLVGVRLTEGKGAQRIEQVVRALVRRRPETSITVVAQGPGAAAITASAGDRVQVIDPVPHEGMPRLFAAHRIAIGQMRLGAIGNYELEALAAGLPVVASFTFESAYPSTPPVIGTDDPDAAADVVAALLDDEDRRRGLGASGRSWVAANHGDAAVAARLASAYAEVLGR